MTINPDTKSIENALLRSALTTKGQFCTIDVFLKTFDHKKKLYDFS